MNTETLIENEVSPAVVETVNIPEAARPFCDAWGNFTMNPLKTIEENHDGNFINVFIYQYENCFYYGYQLKLNKIIKQKKASVFDPPIEAEEKARRAAQEDLKRLVSERKIKKVFLYFDKICYNQPELF
ncbi:hypothetical protein FACS189447_07550 [Spirochaetia bacterium]|nr:hypothetical protein FACS189447_07550 [Spirochaetia bacterium]